MSTENVLRANVRELQEQASRLQARLAEVIAERDAALEALKSGCEKMRRCDYVSARSDMLQAITKLENRR